MNLELLLLLRVDERTRDIGRQQVGSELDTAELCVDRLGEGADREGLGQTGHTFQEYVASGKHGNHQVLHEMLLPHYHLAHLEGKEIDERAFLLYALVELFYVHTFHIF